MSFMTGLTPCTGELAGKTVVFGTKSWAFPNLAVSKAKKLAVAAGAKLGSGSFNGQCCVRSLSASGEVQVEHWTEEQFLASIEAAGGSSVTPKSKVTAPKPKPKGLPKPKAKAKATVVAKTISKNAR
mmetsp:Transcript_84835/g.150227  ORF Transcript_84835/g.150227 Transcript_84835/m.150227 type:complete len:127 (+) Transcript_84835:98-478(+)